MAKVMISLCRLHVGVRMMALAMFVVAVVFAVAVPTTVLDTPDIGGRHQLCELWQATHCQARSPQRVPGKTVLTRPTGVTIAL
jgi:hypothetical protein